MNKFLKIALIALAAVVVLLIVLVGAAKLYFTQTRLKALIIPRIEQTLQRQVAVGEVSLKLFPHLVIRMQNLSISNPTPGVFDQPYFVKLDQIDLDVSLKPLLRKELKINQIILQKPQVYLELNADSVANYAMPPTTQQKSAQPGKSGQQFSLLLSDLQIKEGQIEYVNKKADQRMVLAGLNQAGTATITGGGQKAVIRSQATVESFSYGSTKSFLLSNLPLKSYKLVTYDQPGDRLLIDSVQVELSQITLTAKGSISDLSKAPLIDLTMQSSQAELAQLLSLVPKEMLKASEGLQSAGKFQFNLAVKGTVSDSTQPAINGSFTVLDGSMRYAGLPKSITNVNFAGTFDQPAGTKQRPVVGRLDIDKFSATLGSNTLTGKLNVVNFLDPTVKATFNGLVNLGEVKDYYPLEKGTELQGQLKANVLLDGKAKVPTAMKASGQLDFQNVSIKTPTSTNPLRNLNGTITFNNQVVEAKQLSVNIGQSDLALAFTLRDYLGLVMKNSAPSGKPSASVTLRSKLLRTQDLLPESQPTSKSGQKPSGGAPLPNINIDANVSIDKLITGPPPGGFEFTNAKGSVQIRDGIVNLQNLSLNAFQGAVTTKGTLDLRPNQKNAFNLTFNISNVEANALLPKFTSFGSHLFGKFTLNGALKGSLNDTLGLNPQTLAGDGKVQINQGKLVGYPLTSSLASFTGVNEFKQMDFTNWSNAFKIANGRLSMDDLKIASKNADFVLSGSQGLDGSLDYKLLLKLPASISNQLKINGLGNELLNFLKDKDGRINLDFLVKGTALKPALSLDQKKIEAAAKAALQQKVDQQKQQLEDELKKKAQEQLEKLFKP